MPPFVLPVPLALCRPVDRLPTGPGWSLEAKLDGWRCVGASGRLWSRHGRELTRAFADVSATARQLPDCVLDGELVAALNATGEISFARLQSRSGRGPRPGEDFTVHWVVFDILALGDVDFRRRRYSERRAELLRLLDDGPTRIRPVPASTDPDEAMTWVGRLGGVEGLVAKPDISYGAGRTASGWLKWRRTHTTSAIVVGVHGHVPATQALVLARPRTDGRLRVVGLSLPVGLVLRREIAPLLHPDPDRPGEHELPGTVGGLPGSPPVRYVPVLPEVVVDLEVDQAGLEFGRYRHRPRVARIRADLDPTDVEP
jgi:ATP-dependent DNA ligase